MYRPATKVVVGLASLLLLGCRLPDRYFVGGGYLPGTASDFVDGRKGFETEENYALFGGVSGSLLHPSPQPKRHLPYHEWEEYRSQYQESPSSDAPADEPLEEPPIVADLPAHWWQSETFLAWLQGTIILVLGVLAGRHGPKTLETLRKKVLRRDEDPL